MHSTDCICDKSDCILMQAKTLYTQLHKLSQLGGVDLTSDHQCGARTTRVRELLQYVCNANAFSFILFNYPKAI